MSQVSRNTSKTKFETGDRPTQQDFIDLHDSVKWYDEGAPTGGSVDQLLIKNGASDFSTRWGGLPRDYKMEIYSALGSAIKAEPVGANCMLVSGTTGSLVSQSVKFVCVYLPKAATITGIKWYLTSAAPNFTASNYNGFGLYTYDGAGNLALVASSVNSATVFNGTPNTLNSTAFSSPYPAAPGVYFAAHLYSASASVIPPALGMMASVGSNTQAAAWDFANSAKLYCSLTGQNSLPLNVAMSALGLSANPTYLALY